MMKSLLAGLLVNLILVHAKEGYPQLETPLGGIKGYYKTSENGRVYEAYEGIPYAYPPVGKLRFKAPKKLTSWPGVLAATKVSHACLQYSHLPTSKNDRVEGSEDCLYLNVYVPVREEKSIPLPVIIWIHGGCFQYGTGNVFGAKYLADKDVILVTINYRLGILGFLSTEDDLVPGNMGLKDQSMAIRWVNENIEHFGGDPKKITLTGLSAGGASVHYHYLSPLSDGLFQNGISFSGTALLCWAQTENSLEKAKKLGDLMGCPTDCIKKMINCLKNRPGKAIVQATEAFMPWMYNPYTPFGPVVEKSSTEGYFINKPPIEIISNGNASKVPWFTGVVSEEGLYPAAEFITEKDLKHLTDNWELVAPYVLDYNYTLPKEKHNEVAKKIKKHYFGSKPIDKTTVKQLVLMVGDRLFVTDSEKAARLMSKFNKNSVKYYYYSYRAIQSLSEAFLGSKEDNGVSHGDDAYLVIEQPWMKPVSLEDKEIQKDLLNFWVSVAVNGKPDFGVEWPEINPKNKELEYLHISGPGKYVMEKNDNLGQKKLWKSISFNENIIKKKESHKKKEEL